jgi:hypothetical protein
MINYIYKLDYRQTVYVIDELLELIKDNIDEKLFIELNCNMILCKIILKDFDIIHYIKNIDSMYNNTKEVINILKIYNNKYILSKDDVWEEYQLILINKIINTSKIQMQITNELDIKLIDFL